MLPKFGELKIGAGKKVLPKHKELFPKVMVFTINE
jgi:hypothetical protein